MKSDIRFKWTCIALLAIAVMLYAFDSRYKEVQHYGQIFDGKSVLWDTWTNDIVFFGQDDGVLVKSRVKLSNEEYYPDGSKQTKPKGLSLYKDTPANNRYQVYVILNREGYNTGWHKDMEKALFESGKNRRWTYNALKKAGYDTGSYYRFKKELGLTLWQRWFD